ncbi:SH3 domain-containing protein [Phycomyces blakesleeanus]|uniref:SH3 domain-containing protein n=2 Tax=Phycomyces blakesleeanus TaxID=4837 RepID=A0A167QF45_PHYB8|nr:hypothetical protein PHYBLDRAFT_75576 [Phycomyces blakesleeanus NRRL 1555(-)]OAD79604.1 hypothetical protein PHYBLDRAFT_75576 [Phycomyces blakesleeanus NRRL 1555(-)]|eukprot:XP_018297644.1 hypothetical protein PHYBLDRAFT_75576 [Phycomyces blakesleeanus NRRL 1555(-)]
MDNRYSYSTYSQYSPYPTELPESPPPPCPPSPPASVLRELAIDIPIGIARALYDYTAQSPLEISFRKGDLIQVTKHVNPYEWCGTANSVNGIFPKNYVEPMGTFVPHNTSNPAPETPPRPAAVPAPTTLPMFPNFGTGHGTQFYFNPDMYSSPLSGVENLSGTQNQFDRIQYMNEIQKMAQQNLALMPSYISTMNSINQITQVQQQNQFEEQQQMVQQKIAEILNSSNSGATNPIYSQVPDPTTSSTKSKILGTVVNAAVSGLVGNLTGGATYGLF